jgi:hypothetical protein
VDRFIDRLRGGRLRPFTPKAVADPVEYENTLREQVTEEFILSNRRAPSMEELGLLTRAAAEHDPVRGTEKFDLSALSGIPVIAADDVARYCMALPAGTDVSDVVATMAPPFNRFFVDVQDVLNGWGATAWGVYVESRPSKTPTSNPT